ncbi:MAG: alpha/beta hydrolase [Proteobacteria bacterium]|nr:alpha/beta hydrolase [Pseudomonadota bacterium]
MSTLALDGVILYYETFGELSSASQIITLVNGHTRSSSDFKGMARQLENAGMFVISVDNRGAGRSEVSRPFTLDDMQDDVVAVWNALNVKRSALLGISMGGFICQGLAIRHRSQVEKLILVSTANDGKWIKPTGGGWINEANMVEEKLASYFAPGFVERNKLLFESMVKQTKIAISGGQFTSRSNMQKDAVATSNGKLDLSIIDCPTLIVHGDQDQIIDIEGAKDLLAKIRGSKLKVLPGVGHLILAESPKILYQEVIEFLTKK